MAKNKKKKKYTSIGGQALMEGIMMRGPERTMMCVRRADGSLVLEEVEHKAPTIWNKIPIVRGMVSFIQSMTTGTKTLMRSADIAIEDEMAQLEADAQKDSAPTEDNAAAEAVSEEAAVEEIAVEDTVSEEAAEEVAEAVEAEEVAVEEAVTEEVAAEEAVEAIAEEIPTEEAVEAIAEEIPTEEAVEAIAEEIPTEEAAAEKSAAEAEVIEPEQAKKAKKAKKGAKKEPKKESENGFVLFLSALLGFGLAIVLFFFLPTWIVEGLMRFVFPNILPQDKVDVIAANQAVWRPIFEGIVKVLILVTYIAVCSLMSEIKTLFQYHGAEHKTIFCYEAGEELTVENVRRHKRFHPRCGTSFLILMMLVGIIAGIVVKTFLPAEIANSRLWYPLIKLAIIPLTMGVGYELLKLAGKHDNFLTRIISAPGMWMQRLTTKEPTDEQIECAIAALQPVIPEDGSDMA